MTLTIDNVISLAAVAVSVIGWFVTSKQQDKKFENHLSISNSSNVSAQNADVINNGLSSADTVEIAQRKAREEVEEITKQLQEKIDESKQIIEQLESKYKESQNRIFQLDQSYKESIHKLTDLKLQTESLIRDLECKINNLQRNALTITHVGKTTTIGSPTGGLMFEKY